MLPPTNFCTWTLLLHLACTIIIIFAIKATIYINKIDGVMLRGLLGYVIMNPIALAYLRIECECNAVHIIISVCMGAVAAMYLSPKLARRLRAHKISKEYTQFTSTKRVDNMLL